MENRIGGTIMEISNTLLETYIEDWKTGVDWSEKEYDKIIRLLSEVSMLNGGRIKNDVDLENNIRDQYLIKTIDDGLNKVVRTYAGKLVTDEEEGHYWKEKPENPATFDFTKPVEYYEKVNLNTASLNELATIPLIDETIAERIMLFREENGYFTEIEELLKIDGLDESDLKSLSYALIISKPKENKPVYSTSVDGFITEPDFIHFLDVLKKEDTDVFSEGEPQPLAQSFQKELIKELKKIVKYLNKNHYPKYGKYRRVRASRIKEDYENHQFVKSLEENAQGEFRGASVLDDTQYLYFLIRALKTAQKKIRIIMFFMAYKDEEKYPTDKIMDEIMKARQRGVDVKIILDKDAEGDVYGSRIINYEAYKKFIKNGIDVLFDFEEKVTHSKIVIIDDEHVIVGSHNFTAGSFYAYDDKSIYVESKDFNEKVSSYFDELWANYSNK